MEGATISAVIPTYNRPNLFRETFESVIQQTRQPDEIIIIDDSDEDYVSKIRKEYDNLPDIKHIRDESHESLGDVLNTGIQRVSGDFIFMMDDDDRATPQLIERELAKIHEEDISLCTAEHQLIDKSGNKRDIREISLGEDELETLLLGNELWTPSGVLYRTEVVETVGDFDATMSLGSDWDFFIRVARDYGIGYIDEPLVEYRIHDDQMTSEEDVDDTKQLLATIHRKYGSDARSQGVSFYRQFQSQKHMWIAGDYSRLPNKLTKGVFHIALGVMWCPEKVINISHRVRQFVQYIKTND